MKRLSFLFVTLGVLAACGGTHADEVKEPTAAPGQPAASPTRATSGDVAFEVPAIEIKGVVYEPEALGKPGMPLIEGKAKVTSVKAAIEKERGLVQSSKDPVVKQAHMAILATLEYKQIKTEATSKDDEKDRQKKIRQELRDVAQQVGDKAVDELTLRLLGTYDLLLDDYASAETSWRGLIDKDPKAKELAENKAWLAFAQLKQFKNSDALATVSSEKPDEKQPELAYVTAWAKLRTGDGAGAWAMINAAARGWGDNANPEILEREVLSFGARGGVPIDQISPAITVLAKAKKQQGPGAAYDLLTRLGLTSMPLAGRWDDAIAALDKAIAAKGSDISPNDALVIRSSQVDFSVRIGALDQAAKFGKLTIDVAQACSKCNEKERADIIKAIYQTGQLLHGLFATSGDKTYYQPAHDLYTTVIPVLGPAQAEAKTNLNKLETSLKNLKPNFGTHDKSAIGVLLRRHDLEIQACYEAVLGNAPKIGGNLVVDIDADGSGAIKGISTEPRAGQADLAAVAGCAAGRVKQWKLPKRGIPGTTRIKLTYALSIKK